MELHEPRNIALCFDHGRSVRYDMFHGYKADREKKYRQMDEVDRELYQDMRRQVGLLKKRILPALGFSNVFYQSGLEGDDIIAKLCETLPNNRRGMIVGRDHDFYQLICRRITMWDPNDAALIRERTIAETYGVGPDQWVNVKSIAGCKTDSIPGIAGVGEKTAAKFIAGRLAPESKAFQKITKGNKIWRKNLKLVSLPHKDTKPERMKKNKFRKKKWLRVLREFGIRTIPCPMR